VKGEKKEGETKASSTGATSTAKEKKEERGDDLVHRHRRQLPSRVKGKRNKKIQELLLKQKQKGERGDDLDLRQFPSRVKGNRKKDKQELLVKQKRKRKKELDILLFPMGTVRLGKANYYNCRSTPMMLKLCQPHY